jgi:hypothetical protein
LPHPATVDDNSVTIHPTIIAAFSDYLETPDEWKPPLLEHLECISGKNRLREIPPSGDSIKFKFASNGGARDDLGSFGRELAVNRETLWKCKGPTFGLRPGSFRAESCRFVSALLFTQAHIQHFNAIIEQNVTHNFYRDSKSLLPHIQRSLHRPWLNPSQHCLASDFDLESGIVEIIVSLSVSFQCLHLRSHQDDNNKVHLLPPWEAQMNVHADALANDCLGTMRNLLKLHHSLQHLKLVSQSTAKPLLDDMQNKDSDKQLAAQEHARGDSWPGTPGL